MKQIADYIYSLMQLVGYEHPIHPVLVHVPIGLIVGSVVLAFAAPYFKNRVLDRAAFYTLILALVFYFPTVFMGILDWQHFYGGAWIFIIQMKIAFSALLFVLLSLAIYLSVRNKVEDGAVSSGWNKTVLVLILLNVGVLGYLGGNLVYGGKRSIKTTEYKAGAVIYEKSCASCHPQGGNIITPEMPVLGSDRLVDVKTFSAWIRNPDLTPHQMTAFPADEISDAQVVQLRDYIVNVLEKPRGK